MYGGRASVVGYSRKCCAAHHLVRRLSPRPTRTHSSSTRQQASSSHPSVRSFPVWNAFACAWKVVPGGGIGHAVNVNDFGGPDPQYELFADESLQPARDGFYNAHYDRPVCLELLGDVSG